MLFNRTDLRVAATGEFNVNKGLLFIHHQRAGPEREDIGPDIAAGKELIDPRDRFQIRAGNPRDKISVLYHAPQFRDFFHQPFRCLSGNCGGEKRKGIVREEWRAIHGKSRVHKRGSDRDKGVCRVRSPSSTMMTYIWANTSSMNRFPQEQDCPNSSVGRGARLSSVRMLHSGQGRKREGSPARISFADRTQSIPHTGHFMLLP